MNKYANWEASEHAHHDPLALVTALIREREELQAKLEDVTAQLNAATSAILRGSAPETGNTT